MLIIQNSIEPAKIRHAIVDTIAENTTDLRVASAYVTSSGSDIFLKAAENSVKDKNKFNAISKTLITSFDFGITEPQALRRWLALENATVLVSGTQKLVQGSVIPERAFHPKMYAIGKEDQTYSLFVGSANLTNKGLSVNTEVVWMQQDVPLREIENAFEQIHLGTQPLTTGLLASYEALRRAQPPPHVIKQEAEPVAPPTLVDESQLLYFLEQIEEGVINPAAYDAMWIQVEGLQGGSRNQLELPRGGHKFFGFDFQQYDHEHNITIGYPQLRSGAKIWKNRPLTWHGSNGMERLNLPTVTQGGFNYANSAVMFRRQRDGSFELIVEPWESNLARAWQQASIQRNMLFRLGTRATSRLVGII